MSDRPRFTILGKAISFLLVIGLIALGAFMLMRGGSLPTSGGDAAEEGPGGAEPATVSETTRPPASRTTRWARCASARSWVTSTTVVPILR